MTTSEVAGAPTASHRQTHGVVCAVVIAVFLVVLIRTAWVGDDAYITFRTADNFIHGYGLRWNVAERVQAYTHPLWLACFTGLYAMTHEAYFTGLALAIVTSLAALAVYVVCTASSPWAAGFGVAVLLSSKAFVDFSTSGLENPLTHLLLLAFLYGAWRWPADVPSVRRLSFIAALIMLNRIDVGLMVLPALAAFALASRSARSLPAACVGMLPLLAWEVFSIAYYGFAFPNTAYAKLNTGVPSMLLWRQASYYFADVARFDPVTAATILVALAITPLRRTRGDMAVWLGVVAYLVYLFNIGGDFMRGRFFAAPLLASVALLTRRRIDREQWIWPAAAVVALCIGLSAPYEPSLLSGTDFGAADPPYEDLAIHGIMDERRWYYPRTGLLTQPAGARVRPAHRWARVGRHWRKPRVVVWGNVGFFGFHAGPRIHVVDSNALGDPLLARLPARPQHWRIGHFSRMLPQGYMQTLETGTNHIANPSLAEFYDQLVLITRGPLWAPRRWAAIWRMNLGRYDGLIEQYVRDAGRG